MNFDKPIKTATLFVLTTILFSCNRTNSNPDQSKIKTTDSISKTIKVTSSNTLSLKDTTIAFLWRANKYDDELKDTFNSIFINEEYCKTISDPERAALGYVATMA